MYDCRLLRRALALGCLALGLSACSTAPIPVEPSRAMVHALAAEHAAAGQAAATSDALAAPQVGLVAVCYNSMVNTDAEVWAEAQRACPNGRLTLREDDYIWTRCPLLQPERANFLCVPTASSVPVPAVQ